VQGSISTHPWVRERLGRVRFGLQASAAPGHPEAGKRVVATGILTEQLWLDAFFISDHPGRQGDPWLHLAPIAVATERITLGSVVLCNGHRHPVMTARLAADVDNLSGGRTILGLGIGWIPEEFGELGLSYPGTRERQRQLDEAIAIIQGVWGEEPFSFSGAHYQVANARITPRPVQQPRPPLMIAGAGEQGTLRQVARLADISNFGPSPQIGGVVTPDDVRAKYAVLRRHCEEAGRDYDSILRTYFTPHLILAETQAAVEAKTRRAYPQGLTDVQKLTRVIGTPDDAVSHYKELVDAGVQYFTVQSLDAADEETFRLLAEEVAPRVGG
jgi:alkanesulfonate monooxygenase SsuD/methylene tetrahydromethanopterin reductase-like flavin-dependent oxidoreductase (luciferase family)